MCISNTFAANAGAAGLGTTLLEPPIQVKRLQSTGRTSSDQQLPKVRMVWLQILISCQEIW